MKKYRYLVVAIVLAILGALGLIVANAAASVSAPVTYESICGSPATACVTRDVTVDALAGQWVEFAVHCSTGPVGSADMWFHVHRADGSVFHEAHVYSLGEDGFEWQLASDQPGLNLTWRIHEADESCHWKVYVGPTDGAAATVLTGY